MSKVEEMQKLQGGSFYMEFLSEEDARSMLTKRFIKILIQKLNLQCAV